MAILYDFHCPICDNEFEAFATSDNRVKTCPHCGNEAQRLISPVRSKLDGTDPSFPGEWAKWERKRARRIKEERKHSSDS